jgi:broad specificity phosphatase PhoE
MKTLLFIRHGHATHNSNYNPDHPEDYFDAPLTEIGIQQAQNVSVPEVELVVVSPLTRAIETALYAFPNCTNMIAHADARETTFNSVPFNRRRPLSILSSQFPKIVFESEAGVEIDDRNIIEDIPLMTKRIHRLLKWIHERPESRIAIVSHCNFLSNLFMLLPSNSIVLDSKSRIVDPHQIAFGNCDFYTIHNQP